MNEVRRRHEETAPAGLSVSGLLPLAVLGVLVVFSGFIVTRHLVDFPVYYAAGRSLISGRTDLYAPDFALGPTMDYRYPPFFLTSLIPLWHLPYGGAAYLWYILGILEILVCGWAVSRALSRGRARPELPNLLNGSGPTPWQEPKSPDRNNIRIFVLTLLAVAQYYVMALHYGNAQLLVTALVLLAMVLAVHRWSVAPGALLALAIAIKITPALFLMYFALKRRWKLVAITVSLLGALNLAPALYFGFHTNAELIGTWYRHVLVDQEFHEINGPINLSLKGQLLRSLTRIDYNQRVDGDTRYSAVNLTDYAYRDVNALWLALDASLLMLGLALISRSGHVYQRPLPRFAAGGAAPLFTGREPVAVWAPLEIGIMLCLMLLAEPLTSKIYFVALIWPIASLFDLIIRNPESMPKMVRWSAGAIVVTNVVLPLLPGRSVQRFLLVLGLDFYLTCLILGLLVWALLAQRRPAARR